MSPQDPKQGILDDHQAEDIGAPISQRHHRAKFSDALEHAHVDAVGHAQDDHGQDDEPQKAKLLVVKRDGFLIKIVELNPRPELVIALDESPCQFSGDNFSVRRALAAKRQLPDWAMLGGIYGPNELVAGARAHINGQLKPFAKQVLFFSRDRLNLLRKLVAILPLGRLRGTVESMHQGLNLLEGVPSRVALPLAYLKNPFRPTGTTDLSPDRDHCGLIWFAPLLPIDPALARDFTQEVTRICLAIGIDPLITLTAISERCFDSTIPIVFDGNSASETDKAHRCYDSLIALAREFGVFPYRLDIEAMRKYLDGTESSSLQMMKKIKNVLDPNGILAPGRYSSI